MGQLQGKAAFITGATVATDGGTCAYQPQGL